MRLAVPILLAITAPAAAQGPTTGALSGTVLGPDSLGIADAVVTVTNTADGERWRATTRSDGRYVFEYLSVGGPYAIKVRAIGFKPASTSGIRAGLPSIRSMEKAKATEPLSST